MGDELTRDVIDELYEITRRASQGEWYLGYTGTETIEEAQQYASEMVGKGSDPNLHLVFIGTPENALATALTGNGPTSEANAYYIATFHPANVRHLLDTIVAQRQEIAGLMEIVDRTHGGA